jgi:predicted component of type VI protein secretion system
MFGHLKNKVFARNLHTTEELQAAITQEIANITPQMLINVFESLKRRVNILVCLHHNGAQFEQYQPKVRYRKARRDQHTLSAKCAIKIWYVANLNFLNVPK